jgi:hypothetical protein
MWPTDDRGFFDDVDAEILRVRCGGVCHGPWGLVAMAPLLRGCCGSPTGSDVRSPCGGAGKAEPRDHSKISEATPNANSAIVCSIQLGIWSLNNYTWVRDHLSA